MIYVFGAGGNMGQRYCRILEFLGQEYTPLEIDGPFNPEEIEYKKDDKVIIATPTDSHYYLCKNIRAENQDVSILCEKPLSKIPNRARAMAYAWDVKMVCNYKYMGGNKNGTSNKTSYNYYKSGCDGIYWDCIQLIYLDNGSPQKLKFNNHSPFWNAELNGVSLRPESVDESYVEMIELFLDGNLIQKNEKLIEAHEWAQRETEKARLWKA